MAIRFLPFDSTDGDRVITSADFAELFSSVADDGYVMGEGGSLAVSESSPPAMTVNVATGAAWVQGRYLQVYNTPETLVIPAADATNPRIDRIVVRRDLGARTVSLAVKVGTPSPATNVAPPALQRDATIWEISLAQVRVNAGVVLVNNANITDERGNEDVCGISTHPSLGGAQFIDDADDAIKERHIDWGTGTGQISAVDIPISDAGANFTATDVEGALAEAADELQAHESRTDNPHGVTAAQAGALPTGGGTMTGSADFNNNVGVRARDTAGTLYDLIKINNYNNLAVGSSLRPLVFLSSAAPQYYDGAAFQNLWHTGNLNMTNYLGRIGRGANWSLPMGAVDAAFPWDTALIQDGGTYWTSAASGRLTVPANGYWLFNFAMYFNVDGSAGITMRVKMNAALSLIGQTEIDDSVPLSMNYSQVYKMYAGDYIALYFTNDDPDTARTAQAGQWYRNIVTITRVGGQF